MAKGLGQGDLDGQPSLLGPWPALFFFISLSICLSEQNILNLLISLPGTSLSETSW